MKREANRFFLFQRHVDVRVIDSQRGGQGLGIGRGGPIVRRPTEAKSCARLYPEVRPCLNGLKSSVEFPDLESMSWFPSQVAIRYRRYSIEWHSVLC